MRHLLQAWHDRRGMIRATPQKVNTVALRIYAKPPPGPIYVLLGDFWTIYHNGGPTYRLGRCESCGAIVAADTDTGPFTSAVHTDWHQRWSA